MKLKPLKEWSRGPIIEAAKEGWRQPRMFLLFWGLITALLYSAAFFGLYRFAERVDAVWMERLVPLLREACSLSRTCIELVQMICVMIWLLVVLPPTLLGPHLICLVLMA